MSINERPAFQFRNVFWPVVVLALPILAYFGWEYKQAGATQEIVSENTLTSYLKRITPTEQMSDKFIDADGDMVADGPKNGERIDPDELVFCPGMVNTDEQIAKWQSFIDHLGKITGKKVSFSKLDSPTEILDQMADGRIHVSSFSSGNVPTAVNKAGFVPAAALASADGASNYVMEIIVPAKSSIQGPADLKGKKLALTIASSHSGYKAPLIILDNEFQLHPGRDYQFVVSGGHQGSIQMVAQGRVDAAAVAADVLADAIASGQSLKSGDYRVIYKSKEFPKGAWGYSCLLKPELGGKVREAFLSFSFAGSPLAEEYKGSKAVKFAPVDYKKDWSFVREIDSKIKTLASK